MKHGSITNTSRPYCSSEIFDPPKLRKQRNACMYCMLIGNYESICTCTIVFRFHMPEINKLLGA